MKPKVSEAEFGVLVTQTGLPLSPEQVGTLYDAYWMLEGMIARVNQPLPLAVEPAHIFNPEMK